MNKILKVTNLNKEFYQNFKKFEVLKGVNLAILPGEVYGFLGPNGSGKTTTLKCILGFLRYDEGEIKVFGEDLSENKDLFKKIGYAPENAYFYDHLNGMEFLLFMGQLVGMTSQEAELSGLNLLEKLGLLYAKDKYVKTYSKGMKQRLGLAASLINDPDLIFWDEPMSGLDPLGRVVVKNLMKELKDNGKTLFFNTHILSDVHEIADKFGILYGGKIIVEENTKSLKKPLEEYFRELIEEEEHIKIG